MVGVCTNHAKNMLLCYPAAQKLLQSSVLWLTALNAHGVLMREKCLTMRSTLDTTGITHNPDSSGTQYLGAWFDWGAPRGGDAWAKQKAKIRGVAQRYGDNISRVLPVCTTALSIIYQRMKAMYVTVVHLLSPLGEYWPCPF